LTAAQNGYPGFTNKGCLKNIDTTDFAGLASQIGMYFGAFAIQNKLTTNMESAWAPVIDGDIITDEPLSLIEAGNVKQDLGFYYHENGRNEGETMMRKDDVTYKVLHIMYYILHITCM